VNPKYLRSPLDLLFIGIIGVVMVPYQVGALIDGLHISAVMSGLLGTAELAAMSLTSILIALHLRTFRFCS
jgi:hypothetical protein